MPTGLLTRSQYTTNPPEQVSVDSELEVRGFYLRNFIAGDGVTVVQGNSTNGQQGPYYSIGATLNANGDLVVAAQEIQATTLSRPTSSYVEQLWVDGAYVATLLPNNNVISGWQIPTTYGDPIAYDEIATYNRASTLVPPPGWFDIMIQEIERIAGNFAYAAVGVNGIGQPSVAPLVASAPIFLGQNDPRVGATVNVKSAPFYAQGDGNTNDGLRIQAAIDSLSGIGGTVLIPAGLYLTTDTLTVPQGVWLVGVSPLYSRIERIAGTDNPMVLLGDLSASSLIYGTGIASLRILTQGSKTAVDHIVVAGTSGAVLRDLLLEGVASGATTTTAITLDPASIGNQFTSIENVQASHVKVGQRWAGTAVTAVNVKNFTAISNASIIAGSKGYSIANLNGNGSTVIGGNLESLATGIDYAGTNVTFIGTRFEGNTVNVATSGNGSGLTFIAPLNWEPAKVTDSAGNTVQIVAPFNAAGPSTPEQTLLGLLMLNGNLTFQHPLSAVPRTILLDDQTTQSLKIQAGDGGASRGGAMVLYGSTHATKSNDQVMGANTGNWRLNSGGYDDNGTDRLIVAMATGQVKIPNTGRLTIAPLTSQTYSNAMTIDVTISNHVIAAVSGTSATSTFTPSAAGSAGDILMITTETDASGQVVVTFGGTFHSSGTQTTAASHFSKIQFSSDGTRWTEDFRTTNLA